MNLLADLENIALRLPPSHVPSVGQLAQVLGALIQVVEHGDAVIDAANAEPNAQHPEPLLSFLTERADEHNQEVARQLGIQAPVAGQFGPGQPQPTFGVPAGPAPTAYPTAPTPAGPAAPFPGQQPQQSFAPGQIPVPVVPGQTAPGAQPQPQLSDVLMALQGLTAQLAGQNQARSTVTSSAGTEPDGDHEKERDDRREPGGAPTDPTAQSPAQALGWEPPYSGAGEPA